MIITNLTCIDHGLTITASYKLHGCHVELQIPYESLVSYVEQEGPALALSAHLDDLYAFDPYEYMLANLDAVVEGYLKEGLR